MSCILRFVAQSVTNPQTRSSTPQKALLNDICIQVPLIGQRRTFAKEFSTKDPKRFDVENVFAFLGKLAVCANTNLINLWALTGEGVEKLRFWRNHQKPFLWLHIVRFNVCCEYEMRYEMARNSALTPACVFVSPLYRPFVSKGILMNNKTMMMMKIGPEALFWQNKKNRLLFTQQTLFNRTVAGNRREYLMGWKGKQKRRWKQE